MPLVEIWDQGACSIGLRGIILEIGGFNWGLVPSCAVRGIWNSTLSVPYVASVDPIVLLCAVCGIWNTNFDIGGLFGLCGHNWRRL
jgi:hypothetical protein